MKRVLLGIFLILFQAGSSLAQTSLEYIQGLPTREIYDLHVDRKGYLWVAHGLGISRYDGLDFIHFTHPEQVTQRSTDIVEDRQGRIWFHNFSGQVFYIEHGQMKYLEAYNYKRENQYPRMALCGDELLVTSQWGLFVCNTTTFATKYIPFDKMRAIGTVSLAIVKDKALIYNNVSWYLYGQKTGLKRIAADENLQLAEGNTLSLQPTSYNDTIFLTANPAGVLHKLLLRNGRLHSVARQEYDDYINAVTVQEKAWIHTRNKSNTTDGKLSIAAYNLTDVVIGKEGNTWYSSLKDGLLVSYKPFHWKIIDFAVDKDDFVRSLNVGAGYFFAGTQKGNLYVMETDTSAVKWRHYLFNGFGSIDFIRFYKNHLFLVGSSVNTYVVNPKEKKIENLLPLEAILDVDFDSSTLYLATTDGFYLLPYLDSDFTLADWIKEKQRLLPFYDWKQRAGGAFLFSPQRSRAIRYDKRLQSLFVSTKNGLQEVNKNGIQPFYINGKEVFASSLWYNYPRLYIATFNDGLWIKENNHLQHFTTANYLFSNTILRLKVTNDHLWLFLNTGIQVFDIKTDQVLQNIDLPIIEGDNVFDVAEKDGFAYLTTAKGVYKVPMQVSVKKTAPEGFMDYVVVNNKDTLFSEGITLPYHKNDVQFFFSSPAFHDPASVSFKYRLVGAVNEWQATKPDERMLRYSSLMPGNYTFELLAVNKYGIQQLNPISFQFTILRPWWKTWWFFAVVNAFVIALALLIIRNKVAQKLKIELMRRRISSDLHDDIGATLSSINIYTELLKEEYGHNKTLEKIQHHIKEVVSRLDDLVWSINPKNDSMEQLMSRIQHTTIPMLEAAGIKCFFKYDQKLLDVELNLENKRNMYLLLKEMVNNVVKHSGCNNCYISIKYHNPFITFCVRDDGKGFDPALVKKSRNGLLNMQYRAEKMNGTLKINSADNEGTVVSMQLNVKRPNSGIAKSNSI